MKEKPPTLGDWLLFFGTAWLYALLFWWGIITETGGF